MEESSVVLWADEKEVRSAKGWNERIGVGYW
jgi:hypothetical protein